MKLCADCNDVQITNNRTYCKPCAKKRKAARDAIKNAAHYAARTCKCGCGKQAAKQSPYAAECAIAVRKARKSNPYIKKDEGPNTPLPSPVYKPTRIVMTAEKLHKVLAKEDQRLAEVFSRLNPQLLAARNLRGAVVGMLY